MNYPSLDDGTIDLVAPALRESLHGSEGGDGWSRWREAIAGLNAWRARRKSRQARGHDACDGVTDLHIFELMEHADAHGRVADVGAKRGERSALLDRDTVYVGVDPCAHDSAIAPSVDGVLVRGVAERLPIATGCVQCVMCLAALDYFVDLEAGVAEFARVLVPGGHLALLVSTVEPVVARVREKPRRSERIWAATTAFSSIGLAGAWSLAREAITTPTRAHTRYLTWPEVQAALAPHFNVTWTHFEPQTTSTIRYVAARVRK